GRGRRHQCPASTARSVRTPRAPAAGTAFSYRSHLLSERISASFAAPAPGWRARAFRRCGHPARALKSVYGAASGALCSTLARQRQRVCSIGPCHRLGAPERWHGHKLRARLPGRPQPGFQQGHPGDVHEVTIVTLIGSKLLQTLPKLPRVDVAPRADLRPAPGPENALVERPAPLHLVG